MHFKTEQKQLALPKFLSPHSVWLVIVIYVANLYVGQVATNTNPSF